MGGRDRVGHFALLGTFLLGEPRRPPLCAPGRPKPGSLRHYRTGGPRHPAATWKPGRGRCRRLRRKGGGEGTQAIQRNSPLMSQTKVHSTCPLSVIINLFPKERR